ncbi:MAG TPA: response regulator [Candidatus Limnocylindrales bacterium]|nr:response regulator [Candidatus Limnocylindrales bacterium]
MRNKIMRHSESGREVVKVLIVDNHAFFRRTLRSYLEEIKGFEVMEEAEEGEDVFKLMEKLSPHLILMDVFLSGNRNSFKICKLLKQRNPALKIILYSLYDLEIQEGNNLGIDGFLVKDALFDGLLPLVREFFQNQKRKVIYH